MLNKKEYTTQQIEDAFKETIHKGVDRANWMDKYLEYLVRRRK